MKKILLICFSLFCGINYANAQILGGLLGAAAKKIAEKKIQNAQNSSHNFIYKKSGEIVTIKKGKEKKPSQLDLAYGIDTLILEDPSIPVGEVCISPNLRTKDIKVILSDNLVYLTHRELSKKLSIDDLSEGIASYRGVQGFQAQEPNNYGSYSLKLEIGSYGDRRNVSQLNLPDAEIIDGEVGNLRGYFSGAKIYKVVFSPKIRKIGKGAFRGCEKLEEIVFPDGVKNVEIALDAFAGCMNLDESRIIVPNGRNDIKESIIKSAALLINKNPNVTREIKWSSDKNCEVFGIRNCYLYFEKCKYQYYTDRGNIVKHGEIECTNGKYQFVWDDEWRRNNVCVRGNYNKGNKDGQWHYSEEYVYKGKQYISEVTANYRDGKLNGEYRYSKKENGKIIISVICNFINGKPFGKYYQMRNQTETIIYYDEYGTKTGPMTIITEDEEHHGRFEHDYLYDYYYIDKKTKEKFTPAGMQGQNKSVKLLQFTDSSGDNAGIVLCGIIGTSTIID